MADDDEKEVDEAPEPKSKKSPIILVVVLVIVTLALSVAIAFFVTTKLMSEAAIEQANAPASSAAHHDPGVFKLIGDEKEGILVNVGGPKSGKFLKTKIILELNPGKQDVVLEGVVLPVADTKIQDCVLHVLRSSKLDEFDAMKQDDLKRKIKDEINGILGDGTVFEVYITSFLLQ